MKELYILGCDVLSREGNIERVDYQTPGTGAVIFFSLKCVSNDTCGAGGRIGMKRKQWLVLEVTERVEELPGRCKERRNPLEESAGDEKRQRIKGENS